MASILTSILASILTVATSTWTKVRSSGSDGNVSLNLFSRSLHIFRKPGNLEDGFLVTRGCNDISVGLLLNTLNCCTLGSHNEAYHTIGHADLHGGLTRSVGHQLTKGQSRIDVGFARGTDLRKVVGSGENFAFGTSHVFFAACDDKHGFFATYGGLDVCIGLGTKCFNLASCLRKKHKHQLNAVQKFYLALHYHHPVIYQSFFIT